MFPASTKILIVDDSSFARVMLRNHLRDMGFSTILEASSAADAQMLLLAPEHVKPAIGIVFSDINMPDATGLELLHWTRGREELKGIPFVILTASQDMNEIYEAGKSAVSHFLLKPLQLNVLKDRLTHVWKKHGEAYLKSRA